MKKLLLGLGTVAAVVSPITTVVACGEKAPAKVIPPKAELSLEQTKLLDVLSLGDSHLSPTDKNKFKLAINAATDIEGLKKIMAAVADAIKNAQSEELPASQTAHIDTPKNPVTPQSGGSKDTVVNKGSTDIVKSGFSIVKDDENILDVEYTPTESQKSLEEAYAKFSESIDTEGGVDPMMAITLANKITKVDASKHVAKIMIVGNSEHNEDKTYFCGVMGYGSVTGDTSPSLVFIWRAFSSLSEINDHPTKGTPLVIKMIPGLNNSSPTTPLMSFNSRTGVDNTSKMVTFLKTIAKQQFNVDSTLGDKAPNKIIS